MFPFLQQKGNEETTSNVYTISELSKINEFTNVKASREHNEKLREKKYHAIESLKIERVLNPNIILKEPSDEDITSQLVKTYAQHYYKNRKLKYKLLIQNLAQEQTEGMKILKDKFLNDLNSLKSTKDLVLNEQAYQALQSHFTMVSNRLAVIEKKNQIIQEEFDRKLTKLKKADKKTEELEKICLMPVIEAQNKFKSGKELNEEETLQVLYSKWKTTNSQLKKTLKKLYNHYSQMAKKLKTTSDYLLETITRENLPVEKSTKKIEKETSRASTEPRSPAISEEQITAMETTDPYILAFLGKTALEVTLDHYKLENLKKKFHIIRTVSTSSINLVHKQNFIPEESLVNIKPIMSEH